MLTISHHRLQGEVVKLKKPYAVLEKKHNEFTTETEYEVVAVLKTKYLFSDRPQPLVDDESKGRSSRESTPFSLLYILPPSDSLSSCFLSA